MSETIVDLIRHGEPVGGRAYRGHSVDDPLSEKGWSQMRSAVAGDAPWHHIISSPLQRCKAFAEELTQTHQIPHSIEERFKEVGFGCWEGRTPDEIRKDNFSQYHAFYNDPITCRPPGSEPLDDFITRVTEAYRETLNNYNGKQLLIVAHAGVIRAIIAHILHSPPISLYRIKVNNAGITRIKHDQIGGHLMYHNCSLYDMNQQNP